MMAEAAVRAASLVDSEEGDRVVALDTGTPRESAGGEKVKRLTVKDLEQKLEHMQSSTDAKFETILKMLHNGPSGQRLGNNNDECRSTGHSKQATFTMSRNAGVVSRDVDELSLQPSRAEVRDLFKDNSCLESSSNSQNSDSDSEHSGFSVKYDKYLGHTENLANIFNTSKPTDKQGGLVIDDTQKEILDKSWRADNPSKISAYKEEYRQNFPIQEQSEDYLRVPGLDDLIEPMLRKRHGVKSVKAWGKSRQLVSQPLKSIESLGYQGQMASRMGIIGMLYLQQGLGTLMTTLKEEKPNIDRAVQTVRDLYDVSSKVLDQCGRSGAFHHLVRRKAAISDTGLDTLKDIQVKVLELPLSQDGVFGKGLESKLKNRKEQKDQLNDLIPELFDRKRKWNSTQVPSDRGEKRQKSSTYIPHSYGGQAGSKSSYARGNSQQGNSSKQETKGRNEATVPPFRIPKKK